MAGDDVIPMWVADMDFKSPPCVIEALKERIEHGIFGYTREGNEYYESIQKWLDKRHGWNIKNNWIYPSPGIVSGISFIIEALTNPGDKIIIQSPVYFSFFSMIKNSGRRIVENNLVNDNGYYRMDYNDLEKKIDSRTKLLILCSPHNPVGRVWKEKELKKLGKICLENDITVVSDEIHSDLILPGNKHLPFPKVNKKFQNNCVTFISPSKTFNFPGLEPGYVIISDSVLRREYQHILEKYDFKHNNFMAVEASKAAYNQGEEWLEILLQYLNDNINYLKKYIKDNIPEIEVISPEGTYLVWLDFRKLGVKAERLNKLLEKEAKVSLTPGNSFGEIGEGFQRINIGCPRSRIKKALNRLKIFANKY